ncbi:MAG: glycosyltransferase family 2 protein [Armatimonadota bacterium]
MSAHPPSPSPRLTIVLTTYQRPGLLRKAVDAILSQDFRDWELIIVDDESKDETPILLEEWAGTDARIRTIRQSNQGHVVGRGTAMGIASPSSEYLLFHDDDDWLYPGALSRLIAFAETHHDAPAVHGIARSIDPEGRSDEDPECHPGWHRRGFVGPGRVGPIPAEDPETLNTLLVWCAIQTPGQVLVRRSAFDAVGGFDPALPVSEDWDLWLRLARIAPIPRLTEPVIHRLVHPGNMTKRGAFMRQGERVRAKFLREAGLSNSERRMAALGGLAAAGETFRWAREELRNGAPFEAARQLLRGVRRVATGLRYVPHWFTAPPP